MNKRTIFFIIGAVLFFGMVAVAGTELRYRMGKVVTKDAVVLVPTGSDFGQLLDSLDSSGALVHEGFFRRFAEAKGLARRVRPGRYQLREGMTFAGLINMLRSGNQSPVKVTFNNIRSLEALAGRMSRNLELDSASLAQYLTADSVARRFGFAPQTFIGMFIPNTYEVYWDIKAPSLVQRMNNEYEKFWADRDAKLARTGLTRLEAISLASIVYEETKVEKEMPRVAGVYINRIRRGMPLQADPTLKYAVGDWTIRRVLDRHKEVESPYNTYKYPGITPGPISMPSIAALDGVLDYEEHNYLFFCANPDFSGSHLFAVTNAEHERNAVAYHRALNRLNIR